MKTVATILIACIALSPISAQAGQRPIAPDVEAAAIKQMASAIPAGSRVKLQTTAGRRIKATLMSVTDTGIVVKREARVPEPAVAIDYGEIARLQREPAGGLSVGKAVGIALAAGAGAILSLFAIALSISD